MHWNRQTLASHFSNEIVERVRSAFCAYWRTVKVPLRSERPADERSTIWSNWIHALAGVYAEAERPDWARDLSGKDAETAARLAPVELNGIPPWLADLVKQHPDAVQATLGKELSAQLDDAVSFEFPGLLADFAELGVLLDQLGHRPPVGRGLVGHGPQVRRLAVAPVGCHRDQFEPEPVIRQPAQLQPLCVLSRTKSG